MIQDEKVYLAFCRIDYEGILESTMELFSTREKAEDYVRQSHEKAGGWDAGGSYDIKEFIIK